MFHTNQRLGRSLNRPTFQEETPVLAVDWLSERKDLMDGCRISRGLTHALTAGALAAPRLPEVQQPIPGESALGTKDCLIPLSKRAYLDMGGRIKPTRLCGAVKHTAPIRARRLSEPSRPLIPTLRPQNASVAPTQSTLLFTFTFPPFLVLLPRRPQARTNGSRGGILPPLLTVWANAQSSESSPPVRHRSLDVTRAVARLISSTPWSSGHRFPSLGRRRAYSGAYAGAQSGVLVIFQSID
ncbi:unnamed protein product [Gadus morhua 'NCC']